MFVKPGPRRDDPTRQLLVRKPNRQFLSPEGEEVPDDDLYWHKMVLEGDVVSAEPMEVKGSAA
ncbi:MAG: DUF2635 domain-containing protein [Rhodopila sp.]|jgi:hypothetical protein